MLNISENSINSLINLNDYEVSGLLKKSSIRKKNLFLFWGGLAIIIICFFLPWTQNIEAKGYVTTLRPEQRPQAVQSVISGRLEKWFIREGDFVNAGDTIVFLSEIKNEYFDPDLIARTQEQVDAKNQSIQSYDDKIKALENQYVAMQGALKLKLEQTQNKILQSKNMISIDSIDLTAYTANWEIAKNQLMRTAELQSKGLKTLSDLQSKQVKLQESFAKVTIQENKLLNQKNKLANLLIELSSIERSYYSKMAKVQSEQQSALSDKLNAIANTSKLQNQLSNYSQRQQFYHITAPQSGYITKTLKKGIGEIIKEGADLLTIMPSEYDLALESYIKPQDLPLLQIGNRVRIRFDGFPAIIVSGWSEYSTGVFSGKIIAIDQFISDNGNYRILISPDESVKKWPDQLRVGTGANSFILLNDVPIWYELWRQLNGFPPDFYDKDAKKENSVKRKVPLKSVK